MNVNLDLLLAFSGGVLTGALFCVALWRSVRRLQARRSRGVTLLMGSAIRVAMVLIALYLITGLRPGETIAALAGFVLARSSVSRLLCWASTGGEVAPSRRQT